MGGETGEEREEFTPVFYCPGCPDSGGDVRYQLLRWCEEHAPGMRGDVPEDWITAPAQVCVSSEADGETCAVFAAFQEGVRADRGDKG